MVLAFSSRLRICISLQYRFQQVKRGENNIEDVYDGACYQSKCGPGGFLSEKYNLSAKLNTDCVAIFRSSHGSIQNIVDRVGTVVTVLKELTNVCWRSSPLV